MANYIIEFSLLYALVGVCFLMLRQRTNYKVLRSYITGALLISLAFPFFPCFGQTSISGFKILLPETLIHAALNGGTETSMTTSSGIDFLQVALMVYFMGSLFFLLNLLFAVLKLVGIINKAELTIINKHKVIFSKEVHAPCSFFSYILLPAAY